MTTAPHSLGTRGSVALAVTLLLGVAAPAAQASPRVFVVSMERGGAWVEIGRLPYDRFPSTGRLRLPPAPSPFLRLRVTKQGGGLAHIDAIQVDGLPPLLAPSTNLLKVARVDHDVVDATRPQEFTFARPRGRATLRLTARIEPVVIAKTPFGYPPMNTGRPVTVGSAFYRYRPGSRPGRLTVDGRLAGEDLGPPLFAERIPCDSGHPQGTTYAWVRDDGATLFVALDFTADNTLDGEADYAAVYARVGNQVREFRVTQSRTRWGRAGFTYTRRVAYQHKVYEWAIPLREVRAGAVADAPVELAFAAYGTAAARDYKTEPLAFDITSGVYGYRYFGDDQLIKVQLFDAGGVPLGAALDVQPAGGTPGGRGGIAADPDRSQFLVVWPESDGLIWGRLVDPAGSVNGDAFVVSDTGTSTRGMPRVEYDANQGRYLVIWVDSRVSDTEVVGRFVTGDGTTLGSAFDIDLADDLSAPIDLAYNGDDQEFLVAFTQGGNCVAWRVDSATGAPLDSRIDLQPACEYPNVAYEPNAGVYLAAWVDPLVGSRIIHPTGTVEPVMTLTSTTYFSMDVAALSATGRFLLVARSGSDQPTALFVSSQTGALLGAPVLLPTGAPGTVGCFDHVGARANEEDSNYGVGCYDSSIGDVFFQVLPIVIISPAGVTTTEQGDSAGLSVLLGTQPSGDVVFQVTSSDPSEATVDATQLVFTPSNWDTPQPLLVTGVNDDLADGTIHYQVRLTADASASAVEFGGVQRTVDGTNLDDDTGLVVSPGQITVSETGTSATLAVHLSIPPTSDVVLRVTGSDPGEAIVQPAALTFTPTTWDIDQTVTVTGVDDSECDGDQHFAVTLAVDDSQSAAAFRGLSQTVTGTTLDDEHPVCGDGTRECGEQCDDGNTVSGDGCSSACTLEGPQCGNGVQEEGEQCDDGNTESGDGCSATCRRESGDSDGCGCQSDGAPLGGLPLLLLVVGLLAWRRRV